MLKHSGVKNHPQAVIDRTAALLSNACEPSGLSDVHSSPERLTIEPLRRGSENPLRLASSINLDIDIMACD